MREKGNACSVLMGKPKRKKPLRKPRRRWEDYTEMNVKKQDERAFTGFVWQRIETCGGLL